MTVVVRILTGQCAGFDGCHACSLNLSFDIILHNFVYLIEIFQPFLRCDMLVFYHALWFALDSQYICKWLDLVIFSNTAESQCLQLIGTDKTIVDTGMHFECQMPIWFHKHMKLSVIEIQNNLKT